MINYNKKVNYSKINRVIPNKQNTEIKNIQIIKILNFNCLFLIDILKPIIKYDVLKKF